MAVREPRSNDSDAEYSPREMLEHSEVRHGPALRGNTNEVEITEGSPNRCTIYDEHEQDAWLSSTLSINRGNLR